VYLAGIIQQGCTMTLDVFRDYCLAKPGVTEGLPFGEGALVFKVGSKMFALAMMDAIPLQVNLKCDPEWSAELRERYEAVAPGYHMNKKHWNTVTINGSIPAPDVREMIDHSYDLVVKTLPRAEREALAGP
jgi:predicted DNA-binding protein (MmcQ/YjbR family)